MSEIIGRVQRYRNEGEGREFASHDLRIIDPNQARFFVRSRVAWDDAWPAWRRALAFLIGDRP